MAKPYVGVTGFMDRNEVEQVLAAMPAEPSHQLMVGVLASWKTANGIKNDWPNSYPAPSQIEHVFSDDPRALNLIHFNTKDKATLYDQLAFVTERLGGPHLHGFQLNVCWPYPGHIMKFCATYLTKYVVLQIGHHAFEAVGNDPKALARKIKNEYPMVEYILLDPSGGLGKPFDPAVLRGYLRELYALSIPHMQFGVAGGLSPDTLGTLEPLAKEFPDLSIDAQGRLRDNNGHGPMNVPVAQEYVLKALAIFENNKTPQ